MINTDCCALKIFINSIHLRRNKSFSSTHEFICPSYQKGPGTVCPAVALQAHKLLMVSSMIQGWLQQKQRKNSGANLQGAAKTPFHQWKTQRVADTGEEYYAELFVEGYLNIFQVWLHNSKPASVSEMCRDTFRLENKNTFCKRTFPWSA